MTVSALDPKAALVVIDLQKGVVGMPLPHPASEIVARSAELARAFRAKGHLVVWVTVSGRAPGRTDLRRNFQFPPGWDELAPELGAQEGDFRVVKLQVGAFNGTPLELILRRNGVTQIFLTGIATSSGVETTAMQAYELGFNVALATDAMTDRDLETHTRCLTRTFPRLGECGTTQEILTLLGHPRA